MLKFDSHRRLADRIEELRLALAESERRVGELEKVLGDLVKAIDDLSNNSDGVAGLHLNGDLATWDELLNQACMAPWLGDQIDAARKAPAAPEPKPEGITK